MNLTQQTFQLRVTSEGGTTRVNFDFTINEPIANISYGNGTYIIPRDAVVDIHPTIVGGAVASHRDRRLVHRDDRTAGRERRWRR